MKIMCKRKALSCVSLEEWIAEVFLVIVNESDFGLELLAALLVTELTDMPPSFLCLPPVPSFHGHGTVTKGTIATLDGNESGVFFVPNEFPYKTDSRVWIFRSTG